MQNFDIIIIGGGPGGYVAAIRGRQLGLSVALIEREHLGGICLNWGCIPTKALLRSSELYYHMQHAANFGLSAGQLGFDIAKITARSRGVAGQLSGGVKHLMKKNGVVVFDGHGTLAGAGKINVTDKAGTTQTVAAKNIIIATGARARVLPGFEPDGESVWTYKEAMVPKTMPKSLLVVGSGAIGIEFASFYRSLGAEVTVLEVQERILPVEDDDISALARKAFEKQGIKIVTGAQLQKITKASGSVMAEYSVAGKTEKITVEKVIMAVGIVGNVENLGLEKTKVQVEKNQIKTDAYCQTAESGIYAIGDVAGAPWLAHKASHEGVLSVEKIAGVAGVHPLNPAHIPGCTYAHPQIASIGLTERAAKALGVELKIGKFPLIGNGKAIALGEADGLVKTIFNAKTGELLGAHLIGAEVTEMVQGFAIAMAGELTEQELMHTVFPHPTISEAMHEGVLAAYGRVIHI